MPGKLRNRRVRASSCAALWTTTKRRLRLMPSTGRPMPDVPLALRLSALLKLCWAAVQKHYPRSAITPDKICNPVTLCNLEERQGYASQASASRGSPAAYEKPPRLSDSRPPRPPDRLPTSRPKPVVPPRAKGKPSAAPPLLLGKSLPPLPPAALPDSQFPCSVELAANCAEARFACEAAYAMSLFWLI